MSKESQNGTSLYDFLYIDNDRIRSYLSQLESAGLLQTVKDTHSESISDEDGVSLGIKGVASYSGKDGSQQNRSTEKLYDFSQSIPLKAISSLSENGLIKDIDKASYGQIILLSGAIRMLDLGFFSNKWDFILNKNIKNKEVKDKSRFRDGVEILKKTPPFIAFRVVSSDTKYSAWSILEQRHMTTEPFDFSVKYGSSIKGEWHVLGLLDVKPYDIDRDHEDDGYLSTTFNQVVMAVRELTNYKDGDYGITPIAIWRKVE